MNIHDPPAIVGGGIACAIGSHAPTVITSIAAGLSRIRSVDQPDVRRTPIVIGLAREEEPTAKHHVLSLLTRAIRGLLAEPPPDSVRALQVLIGWPAPDRPGAPPPPEASALADCIGSRLGLPLTATQVHLVTGATAGAEALAVARDRMRDDPELDACLVAAADSWLTTDAMRWALSRRPLRHGVYGDGMIPAEAGAAVWLARHAGSSAARLVGVGRAPSVPQPNPLDHAVRAALREGQCKVEDVAHLVLDTDAERDAILAAVAMSVCGSPRPWLGTRWSPTHCIGNVGAAAGLVGVLLAAHVLTRHGEGGTALTICCADTEQPVALLLSAPSDPAASLEEPISWAITT
jgi:3-oxoacyl-[acyl-carrier-protein] synthase-1